MKHRNIRRKTQSAIKHVVNLIGSLLALSVLMLAIYGTLVLAVPENIPDRSSFVAVWAFLGALVVLFWLMLILMDHDDTPQGVTERRVEWNRLTGHP